MASGKEQDSPSNSTAPPTSDTNGEWQMDDLIKAVKANAAMLDQQRQEIAEIKAKEATYVKEIEESKKLIAELNEIIKTKEETMERNAEIINYGRPEDQQKIADQAKELKRLQDIIKKNPRVYTKTEVKEKITGIVEKKRVMGKQLELDWNVGEFAGCGAILGCEFLGGSYMLGSSIVAAATATVGTVGLVGIFAVAGAVLGVLAYGPYRFFVSLCA